MFSVPIHFRCLIPVATTLLFTSAASFGFGAAAAAAAVLTIVALLFWNWQLKRRLNETGARIAALHADNSTPQILQAGVNQVEQQFAQPRHRLSSLHPVSGLPMREALLAKMNARQSGLIGALAFIDADRLTAIDPTLAERALSVSISRLRKMLPDTRFAAQIDRAHVALWFSEESDAEARDVLNAISYALSEKIADSGYEIMPQIKIRLARFDRALTPDASSFVSRIIASFALPTGGSTLAAEPLHVIDHAALARERYSVEQDLRQAIARHELRLLFQPLIDAERQCVSGAEALMRWTHADRGPIAPSHFIPIMEGSGLASEIGMWAINAAAREARVWRANGLRHLRVAINLSGLQLERNDLPSLIQRTLQHHELGADAIELELTESIATTNADHCRQIFEELRAMGIKLAVDDFGTGYSGFSSLRQLAFDKIKIDREFVTDVDRRRDSQAICESIIALGRGLGIRVLAEGVERGEEYQWLRRHGCHHFQGYYFAQPLEPAEFQAFVRDFATFHDRLRLDHVHLLTTERRRA